MMEEDGVEVKKYKRSKRDVDSFSRYFRPDPFCSFLAVAGQYDSKTRDEIPKVVSKVVL